MDYVQSIRCVGIWPPRLGAVREFGLRFDRRTTIAVPHDTEPEEEAEPLPMEEAPEPDRPDQTILALAQVLQGVKQLRTVLWVIAVLIAAGFLARWA
jgi:hypothetical protein